MAEMIEERIQQIVKAAFSEIDNDPPEAAQWAVKQALREYKEPQLGCATTRQLIDELAARANVSESIGEEWPRYRTIDRT